MASMTCPDAGQHQAAWSPRAWGALRAVALRAVALRAVALRAVAARAPWGRGRVRGWRCRPAAGEANRS